jgi:hypothetical protein
MGIIVKQAKPFDLCRQAKRHVRKLETINKLVRMQVQAGIGEGSVKKAVVTGPEMDSVTKQALQALNSI